MTTPLTEILIALVKGTLRADFDKTQVRKRSLLSILVPDYMIIQDAAYVKELKTETSWVQFPDLPPRATS